MSKAKLATVKEELAEVSDPPKLAITASDIEIPRLNIIQSSSEIAGEAGSVVLDRSTTILKPDQECQVIPVNALKGWRENVPFGSPEMPRIAWNEEEKKEIESDSEFGTIEFAEIILLFPMPKGADEELYPYPIGEDQFALGKLNVAKDAFRCTYKRLATFSAFNDDPLCSRAWNFKAELLTRGRHSWFVPSLTVSKDKSPEDVTSFVTRITS